VGGYIGGQLSRRYGPKYVITIGLTLEALGIWLYVAVFSQSTTFLDLLPALMLHGIGIGFATSQLTNVVLSDIPPQKAGSASGAAGMVRQVGTALGIALIGAIFVSQATSHVRHDLNQAKDIPPAVRAQVVKGVGDGIGGGAPVGATDTPVGRHIATIVSDGVASAAQPAVAFAGVVVTLGAFISLLVPNIPAEHAPAPEWAAPAGDASDADTDADAEPEPTPA
jgi:MFS family permease